MKTQLEQLLRNLEEDLAALDMLSPQERYQQALPRVDATIQEFRQVTNDYSFADQQQEIDFFKQLRPRLLACRLEEVMRYNITMNQPIGTMKTVEEYLNEMLAGLESFFRLHSFYYLYYKNGFQELDPNFFLRSDSMFNLPVAEVPDEAGPSVPPMSSLFAKFIAYERIQHQLTQRLGGSPDGRVHSAQTKMRWTGETLGAVEVIYGIWLTGQVNHGNASLSQIVRWFETNLEVSIGVVQRQFAKIERRKRYSVTKYLDQMKNAIMHRIEEDHGS